MPASIAALWRYPVKSMLGESLASAACDARGLAGDRALAVLDVATGTIASAKHPRRWGALLQCRAALVAGTVAAGRPPRVRITLADATVLHSDDPHADDILSDLLGRAVRLVASPPADAAREADRSPVEAAGSGAVVQREPLAVLAPGTFFDLAPVHIVSAGSLASLGRGRPAGEDDARRFRPNMVVVLAPGDDEHAWVGHQVRCGGDCRLAIVDPAPRCVVPTLAHGALPPAPGLLRALHGGRTATSRTAAPGVAFPAVLGVYARVATAGMLRVGDPVA